MSRSGSARDLPPGSAGRGGSCMGVGRGRGHLEVPVAEIK